MSLRQPPRQLEDAEKDLKAVEAEHARLSQAWENYSGNNPNKYRSALRTSAGRVRYMRELVGRLRTEKATCSTAAPHA
jgi:hypothetical protein